MTSPEPVTVIARGHGRTDAEALSLGVGARGRLVTFDYERSDHFDARLHRQAERDAGEVLGVAREAGATRAIGSSRGARAVVGALAEEPGLFERVVLVLPPSGSAAGRYAPWLESVRRHRPADLTSAIHVIARRGDPAHPVRIAESWAGALGASLDVFTNADFDERLRPAIAAFLDG